MAGKKFAEAVAKVDRIRASLDRFGERFTKRVLTPC